MPKSHWPTVDPKQSFPQLEEAVLKDWQKNKIFEQSVEREPTKGDFTFYDGPPFATGMPHYGHILQSVIKDLIPRYKTMQGYRVPRRWGWDCHGLPVENLIEKELGLKSKQAIEELGVDTFNEACEANVLRYADDWKKFIPRIGRWVDMENDYKTMNPEYMESVWWVFKELWDKELIYEGKKPMHICPRCVTPLSNFEVGLGYKDVTDLSATAKFKVVGEENTYLLAWTTTPWTLPGNMALAVRADVEYVKVQTENGIFILAKDLVTAIFGESEHKIVGAIMGANLEGLEYEPLLDYYADLKAAHPNMFTVRCDDFVTTDSGTGIVHIAPAFGEDDLSVGKRDDLPLSSHVRMDGSFVPEITDWAGEQVKPSDDPRKTDQKIVDHLKAADKLFESKNYKHSYPHCWRCDTPLLNYATSSWFVSVEKIKEQLLVNNEKINWVPGHVKAGRFGKWLEGARDWAISRNRYWGAPLPVWRCDTTSETVCVGSAEELKKLSGAEVSNFHKQFVDDISWTNKKAGEQAVEITFVRHGETDWNVSNKLQGQTDIPLNDTGRQQAKDKQSELSHADFDLVISSPLSRARETAELLAPGRELIIDPDVIEKSFGEFEEHTMAEMLEKYPEKYKDSADVRYRVDIPGAENHADMLARAQRFLNKAKCGYAGKKVLVICHGALMRYFVHLTGEHDEAIFDTKLPNLFHHEATLTPTFHRIPEVLDCWFESGSMPYAQSGAKEDTQLPADFIAEAQDQTRGWFYTLHVLGTALFDKPAFQNCITSGLILAEDGQKMSKSKQNYPDPNKLIHKHGADAMRLYLMNSPVVRGEAFRFSERGVEETLRGVLLPLWNTYYFFTTYATADGWTGGELPAEPGNKLDRWILSELNILIRDVTENLEKYELQEATRPLAEFMEALTNWYIRRSRRRFWKSESDTDKNEAYATLLHVLKTVSKLLAPVCPFIAESVYRGLTKEKSVHLAAWPEMDESRIDEELSAETKVTRTIISLGLAIRAREDRKVRQPLAKATIALPSAIDLELNTIREELNVKTIEFAKNPEEIATQIVNINARALGPRLGKKVQEVIKAARAGDFEIKEDSVHVAGEILIGDEISVGFEGKEGLAAASESGIVVALDIQLTPELEREGAARDLVRVIQDLRKTADYDVSDRIQLSISGADEILKEWKDYICAETLSELVDAIDSPDQTGELAHAKIALKKVGK